MNKFLGIGAIALALLLVSGAAFATTPPNWDITGTWLIPFTCTYNCPAGPWLHKMEVTFEDLTNGALTGNGGYIDGGTTYLNTWTITSGSVSGDDIDFYAVYTSGAPACSMHVAGIIASDGLSMSGDWSDNCGGDRGGTWTATGTAVLVDADGDGYDYTLDCDDTDSAINPGATEICDGVDNDCDGPIDEDLTAPYAKKQYGVCAGSVQVCDGDNGWIEPDYTLIPDYEATETKCDKLDNDCDGTYDQHVCEWYCIPTQADTWKVNGNYIGTAGYLGVNRLMWTSAYAWGGYFTTLSSKTVKGKTTFYAAQSDFSIDSTNGCSCTQILDKLQWYNPELYGNMKGHGKFGCSKSVVEEFNRLINPKVGKLTGTWLLSVNGGAYLHDMIVVTQNPDGSITGTGGYPSTGPPYSSPYNWTMTGNVTGNTITMTITYEDSYTATINGSIAQTWNSMSGGAGTGGVTDWSATRV